MVKILVYGTNYCPFCRKAEGLLREKGLDYEYISVDSDPKVRAEIAASSGMSTVPQIFIDGESIGGCDDLYALETSGKLNTILKRTTIDKE